MKKLYSIYLAIAIMLISSCASYQNQAIPQHEVYAIVSDEYATIEMVYVGATPNYHIIETHIVNHQDEPIWVRYEDFSISSTKKEQLGISPYSQQEAIASLSKEQKKLKKEKKRNLITGILLTGLSAAVNASAGLSVAENVFYSAESAVYIADESRFYNRNIKGIESEKEYIKTQALDREIIESSATLTKDLLIPVKKWKGQIEILYKGTHTDYILEFKAKDFRL